MNILVICLFIACLFPILSKVIVGIAMKNQPGGYNNHHPRAQQAALSGWGARAFASHQNSFESLIIFAAAVLTAIATRHITPTIQGLAIIYIISRCIYHLFYILDWAALRSMVWFIGLLSCLGIIWLCIT